MNRSVKDRYDVVTDAYFSLDRYADYTLRSEDAIIRTSEWYTPEEMPEVRKLMDEQHEKDCKGADDAFAPVEEKWKKYWSAKEFLKVVVRDNDSGDLREDCRLFQTLVANNYLTGPVVVEVLLATKGMFQMSTPAMNFFPYYWNTTAKDIWETAKRNEIKDNSTAYIDDINEIVRNAIKTIGEKNKESYPDYKKTLDGWNSAISRNASGFAEYIAGLYNDTDRNFTAAEIKDKLKASFSTVYDLAEAKEKLFQLAKKDGLALLAEILSEHSAIKDIYDSIPKLLSENIKEVRKEKIQEANEKAYEQAKLLCDSSKITDLEKAIDSLSSLGTFKEAKSLLKQCSSKLEDIKSTQYGEAISLYEEGTEQSILCAIDKLNELGEYKDATALSKEYEEHLKNERDYNSALEGIKSGELSELREAKTKLEELKGYRDADDLLASCDSKLESLMSEMYDNAMSLAAQQTEESFTEARAIMSRLKPYKDSEEKVDEFGKLISKELIYQSAISEMSGDEVKPPALRGAIKKFESVEGYKDAAEKAAECGNEYETLCKYYYVKARNSEKVLSAASQREAIALYREIPDYDDSYERITLCQQFIESIKEILGLEQELADEKEAVVKLTGFSNRKERKLKEKSIEAKNKALEEKKSQLAADTGSESMEVLTDGFTESEIAQLYEKPDDNSAEVAAAKKQKKRRRWIVLGVLALLLGIAVAMILPDLMVTDLQKHGEWKEESINGLKYKVPEEWEIQALASSGDVHQYYTLADHGKTVAGLEVTYRGDTDLTGEAGYDDDTADHYALERALREIPDSIGHYTMVYSSTSAFEVTVYYADNSVINAEEFRADVCKTFETHDYKNPRTVSAVYMTYTGDTEAGTVISNSNQGVSVSAEYETSIGLGSKEPSWVIKDPVTLEAGKTSKIVITVEGKNYEWEITCTTKPEEEEKEGEEDSSTADSDSDDGDSEDTGGSGRLPSRIGG